MKECLFRHFGAVHCGPEHLPPNWDTLCPLPPRALSPFRYPVTQPETLIDSRAQPAFVESLHSANASRLDSSRRADNLGTKSQTVVRLLGARRTNSILCRAMRRRFTNFSTM